MDRKRSNFRVLIVDDDDASLSYLATILMEWKCIVKTTKDAQQALVTLQANKGLYDLIITEFHLLGMNGFDFQKHIQDQYHIPIIMISNDSRQHLISKALENGAAYFIIKPFGAEDFENIWNYVTEAKKHKLCRKRNNRDEYQGEGENQVVKKPRLVWTTYLHNLFLLAIKQIGSVEKAKPKKILKIMNVPNLTTANVASHLQKYKIFQRDVAYKGMVGGVSERALRSNFASDLPISVVKEIKAMRAKIHPKPTIDHSQTLSYQMEHDNNVLNFDGASYRGGERSNSSSSSYRSHNVKNLNFGGFGLDYVSDVRGNNAKFQVASNNEGNAYENIEFHQQKLKKNVTRNKQNYNVGTSVNEVEFNQMKFNLSNFLMADDMNLLNEMNVNPDTSELKSYMFNFFQDVLPVEQLPKGCDDVSSSAEITTCVWNESPKSSSQNSNKLYNNGGNNIVSPLSGITSCVWNESPKSSSQNSNQLYNNGGNNVLSPLSGITSCVWNESPKSSSHQLYNGGNNVVSPLIGITSCALRESPSSNRISIQLQGNERFSNGEATNRSMEVNMSQASTSAATDPKVDMDLFEAVFGIP